MLECRSMNPDFDPAAMRMYCSILECDADEAAKVASEVMENIERCSLNAQEIAKMILEGDLESARRHSADRLHAATIIDAALFAFHDDKFASDNEVRNHVLIVLANNDQDIETAKSILYNSAFPEDDLEFECPIEESSNRNLYELYMALERGHGKNRRGGGSGSPNPQDIWVVAA